jgi:hypothetical protein
MPHERGKAFGHFEFTIFLEVNLLRGGGEALVRVFGEFVVRYCWRTIQFADGGPETDLQTFRASRMGDAPPDLKPAR